MERLIPLSNTPVQIRIEIGSRQEIEKKLVLADVIDLFDIKS